MTAFPKETPTYFSARQGHGKWVIFYEPSPTSMRFPVFTLSEYVTDPENAAKKVADILNQHWDDT